MGVALHSPKFKYFNFAIETEKEICRNEQKNLKKFGMVIKLKKKQVI